MSSQRMKLSGYQEYCDAPSGEGGADAGTEMVHQGRAFSATAQGPATGKAESINPVSARYSTPSN
ncbi:hypothetical protein DSO57_1008098 [Entomophthora muscae]|uniref:Uncharacterized protein n=1 Tax=Entomophthora muscae TaxID=34485 RepID=A0ACC2RYG5_9FUNG|nr:hypothetical protein DSO57_1008098 [Entomophthora muscae]